MASYNYMMSADEVAQELNCSKSYAYKLVKAMNKELAGRYRKISTVRALLYYQLCLDDKPLFEQCHGLCGAGSL